MRSRKRAPTHPGRILNSHYLEPLSLTITELARTLGVSRKTLSKIVNERGSVTSYIENKSLLLGRAKLR
jgi:addiction module HigA family antidote